MTKRITKLAIVVLVLLLSVGAGAQKVKIQHLAHVPTPSEIELYRNLADLFESQHPDIEVEILVPSGAALEHLTVLVAAGTPPDTIFVANWLIPEVVHKGLLLDIEPYADQDPEWNDDDYFPVTIQQTFYQGGRWGVPRHFSPMLVYYNRDIFQDSGVSDPAPDWTWDDMRETAIRVTKRSEDTVTTWGFSNIRGNDLRSNALMIPIIRSFGGDLFSEDGLSLELASPISAAAVQWIMDLTLRDQVAPPHTLGVPFAGGQLAMSLFTFDQIMALRNANVAFDWELAQVPAGPAGRVNRAASGVHAVVSASDHPQEAWEWIKFLAGPEAQQAFASSGLVMGARRDSAIVSTLMRDDVPPKNLRLFLEAPLDAQPYPMTPYFNEAISAILPALDVAWTGEKPFIVTIEEVKDVVEAILRQ